MRRSAGKPWRAASTHEQGARPPRVRERERWNRRRRRARLHSMGAADSRQAMGADARAPATRWVRRSHEPPAEDDAMANPMDPTSGSRSAPEVGGAGDDAGVQAGMDPEGLLPGDPELHTQDETDAERGSAGADSSEQGEADAGNR